MCFFKHMIQCILFTVLFVVANPCLWTGYAFSNTKSPSPTLSTPPFTNLHTTFRFPLFPFHTKIILSKSTTISSQPTNPHYRNIHDLFILSLACPIRNFITCTPSHIHTHTHTHKSYVSTFGYYVYASLSLLHSIHERERVVELIKALAVN